MRRSAHRAQARGSASQTFSVSEGEFAELFAAVAAFRQAGVILLVDAGPIREKWPTRASPPGELALLAEGDLTPREGLAARAARRLPEKVDELVYRQAGVAQETTKERGLERAVVGYG